MSLMQIKEPLYVLSNIMQTCETNCVEILFCNNYQFYVVYQEFSHPCDDHQFASYLNIYFITKNSNIAAWLGHSKLCMRCIHVYTSTYTPSYTTSIYNIYTSTSIQHLYNIYTTSIHHPKTPQQYSRNRANTLYLTLLTRFLEYCWGV